MLGAPILGSAILSCATAADAPALQSLAGVDRVTIQPGKTYLRAWAGYGDPPRSNQQRPARPPQQTPPPVPEGPPVSVTWSKESGPGTVTFADNKALLTT